MCTLFSSCRSCTSRSFCIFDGGQVCARTCHPGLFCQALRRRFFCIEVEAFIRFRIHLLSYTMSIHIIHYWASRIIRHYSDNYIRREAQPATHPLSPTTNTNAFLSQPSQYLLMMTTTVNFAKPSRSRTNSSWADWFKAGVARQRVGPISLGIAPRACMIQSKLLLLLLLLPPPNPKALYSKPLETTSMTLS